ncbi:aspartate/glutamate racemase family protein [Leucobacter sp. W1153]|uniref:aspartate/glutamate racemase family protein n=1 Tax=Leucobacter sp. W1153 TaxID=3439064 RepID=UPI003F410F69
MKTIGLLGGMSWESTAVYYQIANQLVRERMGGLNSANILLDSLNFAEVAKLQQADEWSQAAELLARHATRLERAGADMILICTNTMHLLYDRVRDAVGVPVLHIGDTVAAAAQDQGVHKVGLLGTAFTMEKEFFRDRIEGHGLEVIVPDPADRALVHRAIFEELAVGIISDSTRAMFRRIMGQLVAAGAQGIILGCTEIELIVGSEDCTVPVFPTAKIHIEAAVDAALGEEVSSEPQ